MSCLLQGALLDQEEIPPDTFEAVLAQIDVPDRDWKLGNYQILEEIGRGGMGVIYRARHRPSGRIVALKRVLSYHSDSCATLSRFQREARAAASLDHPNILPIYDVGTTEDGLPFFSMKFAPGGSLLNSRSSFRNTPRQAVQLVAKLARAVDHAHGAGILHRDLKPGNILLDARGEPLVSDFGLAKWLDTTSDLTCTLTVFGTPGYIAPEQAHNAAANLTPAVDVYSLGAILFELLSGRPPFLGEHAIAVIHQAAENDAPKLRALVHGISRDLETICARCLERDPGMRYQSAGDLAQDLQRWLEGRTITARPVAGPVRIYRWSRRNPALATTIGACALLAAVVVTRQAQTSHLQSALREEIATAHSIGVIPFLDLDQIQPDAVLSAQTAHLLERAMSSQGPCRVGMVSASPSQPTGESPNEIERIAQLNKTRVVLTGTRRRIGEKLRISLHLFGEDGTDVLGNWIVETSATDPITMSPTFADVANSIFKMLDKSTALLAAVDPVMSNERARKFFIAGRDLMARRTVTELNRAISCLENSVREEPKSIDARSFLAMAYMGRYMLSAEPELPQRALSVAEGAVALAPQDPTAHRALCVVYANSGLYREALEHGFQSIEFGDHSERAMGQIAFAWRMLGRPDRAIPWYNKARASQRQPADYDALLGDCWAELCADDKAKREYESAITFRPDQPDGWMGLCRLKLITGDTTGARELCRSQLPHYPGFPPIEQLAAMIEFFSRNFHEAERRYTELARNDRLGGGKGDFYGAIGYYSALGRLKIERGDANGGIALLNQAILDETSRLATAPRDAAALYRLAAARASLGETELALQTLRGAIDAGWIDYRSMQFDPRFDRISSTPEFRELLSKLATQVAALGRQSLAAPSAVK